MDEIIKVKVKKARVSEIIVTDKETGEITSHTKSEVTAYESEPPYIKMYIKDVVRLKDLPAGSSKVLFQLLSRMGYNNTIATYKPFKKLIASDLGLSLSYIEDCISMFIKAGLLIRVDRGMYMADPDLFARGSWKDIKELRLAITYNQKTGIKKLKSNISEEVQLKLGF